MIPVSKGLKYALKKLRCHGNGQDFEVKNVICIGLKGLQENCTFPMAPVNHEPLWGATRSQC